MGDVVDLVKKADEEARGLLLPLMTFRLL